MQGRNHNTKIPPGDRKGRGGRPAAAQVGDVDRRILVAAERLFLEQGFDPTTCEQVASVAGAGKASIYARYANKEELFTAVVRQNVDAILSDPPKAVPSNLAITERLRIVGNDIIIHALQAHIVALTRAVIATAYRMPELSKLMDSIGRDRGIQLAAEAIAGAQSGSRDAVIGAMPAAAKFIEIAYVPLQMRALLGDNLTDLAAKTSQSVEDAVELITAGGWLRGRE